MKVQRQIDPKSYQSANGFIYLNDQVEGVEKSHVVANFRNAGRMLRGEDPGDGFYGMIFQDSDAAKWLEAVASAVTRFPDAQLEKEADELIELIAQAQDKDGYLDTRFTLKDRDKRWTNLCEGHELYCMGHMMEAAAAYFEATGKRTLLDVMIRNAEYLYQRFGGPAGLSGPPGGGIGAAEAVPRHRQRALPEAGGAFYRRARREPPLLSGGSEEAGLDGVAYERGGHPVYAVR